MKAKIAALVAAPLLVLSLAGCSGSDTADTTQEEMSAGLTKALSSELAKKEITNLDEAILQDYADCVVEKSWDLISADTRSVIAKGATESLEDAEISAEDGKILEDNTVKCVDVVVEALKGGAAQGDAEQPAQ